MCIQMRSGVEIWKEKDEVEKLQEVLSAITKSTFVHFGEMTINTADIVGVFDSGTMESSTRRRNGDWQCKYGFWHNRNEKCEDCETKFILNKNI